MEKINIGVIGIGAMGYNHVRVLSTLPNIQIHICDINKRKCDDLSSKFNINSYYLNYETLLGTEKLDGVIIALPNQFHKEIFLRCLEYKVNILIEKPIAQSVEDAMFMISKAKEKGILFTVGHVERFNPVIRTIENIIHELGEVYLVNTIRGGPFPKRLYGSPGGVLIDLAVHDAHIINTLIGNIKEVYSKIIKSGHQEIYAKTIFKITDKIIGSSEFSWISPKRSRFIEIYNTGGLLVGDYQEQSLTLYENPEFNLCNNGNLFEEVILKGNIKVGKSKQYNIQKEEPLKLELQNFIEGITNKTSFLVTPEDALNALKVAISILDSAERNEVVQVKF